MSSLVDKLIDWSSGTQRIDDDSVDRLSYRYSTALLLALSVFVGVGGRNLVIDRIRCFTPTELNYHQAPYIDGYCYVASTYYVPINEKLPGPSGPRNQRINYYQWVELFILIQAVLFVAPRIFWRFLCHDIGSQIDVNVRTLQKLAQNMTPDRGVQETREQVMEALVHNTDRYLMSRRASLKFPCCTKYCCLTIYGIFILLVSFTTKLLFLLNALGQIFLINKFLGASSFSLWGFGIMREFASEGTVSMSEIFPVITMCDVDLRALGHNVRTYTVQCVLPVNVFHDRVYLVVWFWLCFVSSMTIVGMLSWLRLHILQGSFIEKHLQHKDICMIDHDKPILREFTKHYLSRDGVFILKLVYKNTASAEFDELLSNLWQYFLQNRSSLRHRRNNDFQLANRSAADMSSSSDNHKYRYNVTAEAPVDYVDNDGDVTVML